VLIRRRIQRAWSLLNDAMPARPTNRHLSRCGWTSPPLIHWELITLQWTYSGYRPPTHAQAASRWIRVSTVVKRSSIVSPAVYRTSWQREIQCSIPRNFSESRVSRVSLTSLTITFVHYYYYYYIIWFLSRGMMSLISSMLCNILLTSDTLNSLSFVWHRSESWKRN